jgi:soluble lytic murein transglycosylase-like protein
VESGYQPRARSTKGALGLMQVMPATGRRYGITNLYDPSSNIRAGVTHLKTLLDRFPFASALAAYNAGEAAVERFSGIPPYPETVDYVARIRALVGR